MVTGSQIFGGGCPSDYAFAHVASLLFDGAGVGRYLGVALGRGAAGLAVGYLFSPLLGPCRPAWACRVLGLRVLRTTWWDSTRGTTRQRNEWRSSLGGTSNKLVSSDGRAYVPAGPCDGARRRLGTGPYVVRVAASNTMRLAKGDTPRLVFVSC